MQRFADVLMPQQGIDGGHSEQHLTPVDCQYAAYTAPNCLNILQPYMVSGRHTSNIVGCENHPILDK